MSAMLYHTEIGMTLHPKDSAKRQDVVLTTTPDPALLAELWEIHDRYETPYLHIECRMHDPGMDGWRPVLEGRECDCHFPPRVHGLYMSPARWPRPAREERIRRGFFSMYFAHRAGSGVPGSHSLETSEHRLRNAYLADTADHLNYTVLSRDEKYVPGIRLKPDTWFTGPNGQGCQVGAENVVSSPKSRASAVKKTAAYRDVGITAMWLTDTERRDKMQWLFHVPTLVAFPRTSMARRSWPLSTGTRSIAGWEKGDDGFLVPRIEPMHGVVVDDAVREIPIGGWVPYRNRLDQIHWYRADDARKIAEWETDLPARKTKAGKVRQGRLWVPPSRTHDIAEGTLRRQVEAAKRHSSAATCTRCSEACPLDTQGKCKDCTDELRRAAEDVSYWTQNEQKRRLAREECCRHRPRPCPHCRRDSTDIVDGRCLICRNKPGRAAS